MALTQSEFAKLTSRLAVQNNVQPSSFTSPTSSPSNNTPISSALRGETSFPASMGGAESIAPNIAKTFGNIPSSAAKIVAPVNPMNIDSPVNIGANIVKSGSALKDIYSTRGAVDGTKDILKGFADTYLSIGEVIYGGLDKAYNALLDDPKKAVSDVTNHIAKVGIEDPLMIPSLLYGGGKGVGKDTISKIATPVIKTAENVADSAIQVGKNIIKKPGELMRKASDIVTPIDPGTQAILNPTKLIPKENLKNVAMDNIVAQAEVKSAKLNKYVKQAEIAVNDFSQPTPLAIAGTKADEALNVVNNKLAKQGQLKQEALGIVGDKKVKNMVEFRTTLRDELRERVGVNISLTDEGLEIVPATGRASKIAFDAADNKLIKDTYQAIASLGDSPTVRQIDDTVDALQDLLYKRKGTVAVPVNGQVEAVIKSLTGRLNKSVKKVAGEQYSKANSKFAYFVDVRDKINKALGPEGVRGATMMKQLFSPSGEANRRMFEEIKKLTGIDLVEEATLAKFVMENVGDARQASLLEEIIKGRVSDPRSFVGAAAQKVIDKLQDPIGKAKRIIKQSTEKPPKSFNSAGNAKVSKGFKEFERDMTLTGDDAVVQEDSITKYLSNKETLLKEYLNTNGKVVNTDEARKLFKDVGYKGYNARAVQEPSSALAKDAWRYLLKSSKEKNALIYSGGSGTGKTSAIRNIFAREIEDAGAILDGNLSTLKSAMSRIKEAQSAGKIPTILYTYREPKQAWIDGVIKRMLTNKEEGGRIVPLSVFLENHKGSYNVVKQLQNGGVDIKMIDNSYGKGGQRVLTQSKFDSIKYPDSTKQELISETKKLLERGEITNQQYDELIK